MPRLSPEEGVWLLPWMGSKVPSTSLLLTLARNQKVDIARISILELADQYLAFIRSAKRMNLELAADYLVMAACGWPI